MCNASLFVGVGRYKYIDHLLVSIAFWGELPDLHKGLLFPIVASQIVPAAFIEYENLECSTNLMCKLCLQ